MADIRPTQDDLYQEAVASCGTALDRVARAYEADPDKRRDLLQEIHVALWQSFENFERRCSLKTWVHRVAHNTATSVVIRKKMRAPAFVDLDEVEASLHNEREQVHQATLDSVWALIRKLNPHDKQVMLLYLEGMDSASIGEVTGFSPGSAGRIMRITTRSAP